jgi:hypothetical protein
MKASVRSRRFALTLLVGLMAASLGSGRPGMYDYWKAGTKRKGSRTLPNESRSPRSTAPATPLSPSPQGPEPWTEPWFADPSLVREHVQKMSEAIRVPMIGERFPLPRGGGFSCESVDVGVASPSGTKRVLECVGPELGGSRWNEFYAPTADALPTLERVRWRILAPTPAHLGPWRAVVTALRDSLTGSFGEPAWASDDSLSLRWNQDGYRTTVRLHATTARAESLEITCVSDRVPGA